MKLPIPLSLIIASITFIPCILLVYLSTVLQRLNSAQVERLLDLEEDEDTYHGIKIQSIFLSVQFASIVLELVFLMAFFVWLFTTQIGGIAPVILIFLGVALIMESFARIILPSVLPMHVRENMRKWESATLLICAYLFFIPSFGTGWIVNRLSGAVTPRSEDERMAQAEETIRSIIDAGEKDGVFRSDEGEMLQSILEMSETIVREVMTPRIDLQAVEISSSIDEFVSKVVESGYSKIPVYKDRVDNIVGILYAKDVLQYWGETDSDVTLDTLKRAATFVPETKRIAILLREFQKEKKHLAIVVDEFGGVAGLVTIEDLLEEIVGEIHDEYDQEEESIRRVSDTTWEVAARIDLDELGEEVGFEFPDDNYETLGGFLFHKFGRVPAPGETYRHENMMYKVTNANDRRIETVLITIEPKVNGKKNGNGEKNTRNE